MDILPLPLLLTTSVSVIRLVNLGGLVYPPPSFPVLKLNRLACSLTSYSSSAASTFSGDGSGSGGSWSENPSADDRRDNGVPLLMEDDRFTLCPVVGAGIGEGEGCDDLSIPINLRAASSRLLSRRSSSSSG